MSEITHLPAIVLTSRAIEALRNIATPFPSFSLIAISCVFYYTTSYAKVKAKFIGGNYYGRTSLAYVQKSDIQCDDITTGSFKHLSSALLFNC